jgi:alkylmercury lyase
MFDTRTGPKEVADYLGRTIIAGLDEEVWRAMPTLLRGLAEGRPVETAEFAAAAGSPAAELDAMLDRFGVERDAAGRIVGAGLTLNPTPHTFLVEGRRLYTWCALDALVFPAVLGRTAEVESPCAATGAPVRGRVGPAAVESVTQPEAVVSFLVSDHRRVRRAFCDHVHFFASAAAAAGWPPGWAGAWCAGAGT